MKHQFGIIIMKNMNMPKKSSFKFVIMDLKFIILYVILQIIQLNPTMSQNIMEFVQAVWKKYYGKEYVINSI